MSSYSKIPLYYRIYQMIKNVYLEDSEVDINKVSDSLLPEDDVLFREALEKIIFPENSDQVLQECIATIRNAAAEEAPGGDSGCLGISRKKTKTES